MSGGVKLKKKSAMMHNEPGRLTDDAIDEVFKWCFEINASDITFQTGQPVWADVYGRIQHVKYTSNGYDGYVADVTYEGTAVYPEAKPYVPAPAPAYHA